MADKSWKAWERKVATDHGGTRTGPRGFNLPDSIDVPLISPECKEYKRLALKQADLDQTFNNALRGKPGVLFLKDKPGRGQKAQRYVVIPYEAWLTFFHALLDYYQTKGETQ